MVDLSRLSTNWQQWAALSGLKEVSVMTDCDDCDDCDDCEIVFGSNDFAFHLRTHDNWWVVDTVDERGHRRNADVRSSTFELAEKYLIWQWITAARSSLASGPLGRDLYRRGYAPAVEVTDVNGTHAQLCIQQGCAVLILGTATIFSHIMLMSVDDIERIGRQGLT